LPQASRSGILDLSEIDFRALSSAQLVFDDRGHDAEKEN
jgi:hypothetical protein